MGDVWEVCRDPFMPCGTSVRWDIISFKKIIPNTQCKSKINTKLVRSFLSVMPYMHLRIVKNILKNGDYSLSDFQTPNFIVDEIEFWTKFGFTSMGKHLRIEGAESIFKPRHQIYLAHCVSAKECVDKVSQIAKKWGKKFGVKEVPASCGCCTKPPHLFQ